MTIREVLLAINAYPIPLSTIESISLKRGIDLGLEVDSALFSSPNLRLAQADVYKWLFFAPDVEQGGQKYSFTDAQREMWKKLARGIYEELGDESDLVGLKTSYGYMGQKL